jgi:hypothetical protein
MNEDIAMSLTISSEKFGSPTNAQLTLIGHKFICLSQLKLMLLLHSA